MLTGKNKVTVVGLILNILVTQFIFDLGYTVTVLHTYTF